MENFGGVINLEDLFLWFVIIYSIKLKDEGMLVDNLDILIFYCWFLVFIVGIYVD